MLLDNLDACQRNDCHGVVPDAGGFACLFRAVSSSIFKNAALVNMQMGGPGGVRAKEVYFVTIQPKETLDMHVRLRGPAPQLAESHKASQAEALAPQS